MKVFGENSNGNDKIRPGSELTHKTVFYVDNVSDDCTEEDLTAFLSKNDIKVFSCFKAKSWIKNADSACLVSCRVCIDARCRDHMLSPLLWPMGVTA